MQAQGRADDKPEAFTCRIAGGVYPDLELPSESTIGKGTAASRFVLMKRVGSPPNDNSDNEQSMKTVIAADCVEDLKNAIAKLELRFKVLPRFPFI